MGRRFGSKAFTQAEDDVIRIKRLKGVPVAQIAAALQRNRTAVYKRIGRMIAGGTDGQAVADLGQADDRTEA